MCHWKENKDLFLFHFSSEAFWLWTLKSTNENQNDPHLKMSVSHGWMILVTVFIEWTWPLGGLWYGRCYQSWGKTSQFMELGKLCHLLLPKSQEGQLETEWKVPLVSISSWDHSVKHWCDSQGPSRPPRWCKRQVVLIPQQPVVSSPGLGCWDCQKFRCTSMTTKEILESCFLVWMPLTSCDLLPLFDWLTSKWKENETQ